MSAGTPFHDLADFVALPRVTALRLAPDGTWLAAAVQTLSADKKKYLTSIWRIDAQDGPARRLTRSAEGEGSPRFLPDGSLLFTSKRPDPAARKGPDSDSGDVAALWLLPAAGGEARVVAALPGGVTAAEVARDAGAIVVGAPVLPGAGNGDSAGDDARLRQQRKDAGITAILHESSPVRFWDHDLGPDQVRLIAVAPDQVQETETGWAGGGKEPGAALALGGPGQPARRAALRVDPPDAGQVLLLVGAQGLHRRGQPGPVGGEPQRRYPRQRHEVGQIMKRSASAHSDSPVRSITRITLHTPPYSGDPWPRGRACLTG